ncbi:MAG: leucyl aminopeptidase family protein [Candidatus Woesearchaeota archaeon]
MKLVVKKELDTSKKLLVLGLFSDDINYYKDLNPFIQSKIDLALKNKTFKHKFGSTLKLMVSDSLYDNVLVVSLGDSKNLSAEIIRRVLSRGVNYSKSLKVDGFTTNIAELAHLKKLDIKSLGLACGESCALASYSFIKYSKKSEEDVALKEVVFSFSDEKEGKLLSNFLSKGLIVGESTNYAKDLVNEPACVVTPAFLEGEAKKLAKSSLLSLKVFSSAELKRLGFNLISAVGGGSATPPRMLVFDYKNSSKKSEFVLLGKGITFDTGGYNIKPTGYMEEMKYDMGGAAAVLGTIRALTLLKPKISASFVIPLAENMISSKAYRPSDIVLSHSGLSVEVLNTDAEGRLILADALSYASKKYKGAKFIDVATLTGAAVIATGHVVAPMMGNNSDLLESLSFAGLDSGDRVWEFPFFEDYQDVMDSDIADLSNISKKLDRAAGSITAGVFLSKFVNGEKWAHIDIAGTAFLKESFFYNQKYATGAGVRLFSYLLNDF